MMKIGDREFSFLRGSDVIRDGIYLEISERIGVEQRVVLEVFYSDENGRMTFTAFDQDLPFELIETIARMARENLTPETAAGVAP